MNTTTGATMTAMADQLMTTGDAAKALGVNPTTLQRWVAAGIVVPTARTAGGHFRWEIDDLRSQVNRHLDQSQD